MELRGAIDAAALALAEAQASAQATNAKLGDALAQINFLSQSSVQDLGLGQLRAAIDHCDEIGPLTAQSIEALYAYGATL